MLFVLLCVYTRTGPQEALQVAQSAIKLPGSCTAIVAILREDRGVLEVGRFVHTPRWLFISVYRPAFARACTRLESRVMAFPVRV